MKKDLEKAYAKKPSGRTAFAKKMPCWLFNFFFLVLSFFSIIAGTFSGIGLGKRTNDDFAMKTAAYSFRAVSHKTVMQLDDLAHPQDNIILEKDSAIEQYSTHFIKQLYSNTRDHEILAFYNFGFFGSNAPLKFDSFLEGFEQPTVLAAHYINSYTSYFNFSFVESATKLWYLTQPGNYFIVTQKWADKLIQKEALPSGIYSNIIGKKFSVTLINGSSDYYFLGGVVADNSITEFYERYFGPFIVVNKTVASSFSGGSINLEISSSQKANKEILNEALTLGLFNDMHRSALFASSSGAPVTDASPLLESAFAGAPSYYKIIGWSLLSFSVLLFGLSFALFVFFFKDNGFGWPSNGLTASYVCLTMLLFGNVTVLYILKILSHSIASNRVGSFLFSDYSFGVYFSISILVLFLLLYAFGPRVFKRISERRAKWR
jgi:hypothetical protein